MISDVGKETEIVEKIVSGLNKPNTLYEFLNNKALLHSRCKFEKNGENQALDFPILSNDELTKLSLGSYQLAQSLSYICEHLENNKFNFMLCKIEKNLICAKIQSSHKSAKIYSIFIKYIPKGTSASSITVPLAFEQSVAVFTYVA